MLTYTAEQLAKELNTSRNLIYILHDKGAIKGIKKGNGYIFPQFEVDEMLHAFANDELDMGNAEAIERSVAIIKARREKEKRHGR